MATWLAMAAVSRELADGFVVGIEGAWGSGKSSLVHLARHQWEMMEGDKKPVIVDFNPWLVGERDALLVSLFDDLRRKIDGIQAEDGDSTRKSLTAVKDAVAKLKSFGRRVAPLRYAAEAIAYLDMIPGATLAAKGLKRIEEASQAPDIEEEELVESLVDLKAALDAALGKLNRRIIVIIDDLDRLEPKEIMEILRLVRSVADFKNVTYVLCYDNHIISEAISRAMQIDDGKKFLEKIVQLELKVPPVHSFTMTQLFRKELDTFIDCPNADSRDRMARVVHHWGSRYLTTPRMLNKVLDTIRFAWPYLKDKVDGPDYVFLQLLRHGNPEYYDWVAHYVASVAGIEFGTKQYSTAQEEADSRKFFEVVEKESVTIDNDNELRMLRRILPQIADYQVGRLSHFYVAGVDGKKFLNSSRLGNFDHYRLYFSGYQPESLTSNVDHHALIAAADISASRFAHFVYDAIRSGDFGTINSFFMTSEPDTDDALSPDQLLNIIGALVNVMDHPVMVEQDNAVEIFLNSYAEEIRNNGSQLKYFMDNGGALSWLNMLVDDEWLGEDGLAFMSKNIVFSLKVRIGGILQTLSADKLVRLPRLYRLIQSWSSIHGIDGINTAIERISDREFLVIMEGLTMCYPNPGKITHDILHNIGYLRGRERLVEISLGQDASHQKAKYLLDRFDD